MPKTLTIRSRSSSMATTRLALCFLMFAGLLRGQGFGSCYYPGGNYALGYYPCHPHAVTSMCCQTGWTCFSNFLCIATDPSVVSAAIPLGTAMRGTRENPDWDDKACGSFCLNEPIHNNNGSLEACGGNQWCCQPESDSGSCNCDTGAGTFSLPSGTAQTIIGVVGLEHTSTGSFSGQSTPMAQSSSTASDASSSVATASTTPTSSPTSATQSSTLSTRTSSTASGTTSSSTAIASPSPSVTSTLGFKLGLGISISVAAIAAFLIWYFLVRPRRHSSSSVDDDSSDGWSIPPRPDMSQSFPLPIPHPNENRTAADLARSQSRGNGPRGPLPVIPERNPHWIMRKPVPNQGVT